MILYFGIKEAQKLYHATDTCSFGRKFRTMPTAYSDSYESLSDAMADGHVVKCPVCFGPGRIPICTNVGGVIMHLSLKAEQVMYLEAAGDLLKRTGYVTKTMMDKMKLYGYQWKRVMRSMISLKLMTPIYMRKIRTCKDHRGRLMTPHGMAAYQMLQYMKTKKESASSESHLFKKII